MAIQLITTTIDLRQKNSFNEHMTSLAWCPYTGAEGAKACQDYNNFLKTMKEHQKELTKREEEYSSLEATLENEAERDALRGMIEIERKSIEGDKKRLERLKKLAEFAGCKGIYCPKARIVQENGVSGGNYEYLYCGGEW